MSTGPLEEPNYVPGDTTNLAGWAEDSAPTVDANGNIVLSIFLDTGGPTRFRIGIVYPVPLS